MLLVLDILTYVFLYMELIETCTGSHFNLLTFLKLVLNFYNILIATFCTAHVYSQG